MLGFRWPRLPFRPNFCLSTKLTLLVVIPLAMTLAVTLPLTVTGLNKLAERLKDEILLVDKHFEQFKNDLERAGREISRDPILVAAVRDPFTQRVKSILNSYNIWFGLQHLEVLNDKGGSLGQDLYAGV